MEFEFTIQEENNEETLQEAMGLASAHYYEVEDKADKVPFMLDTSLLGQYLKADLLYIVTARDLQGTLVGYFANMISPDPITSLPIGKELGIYVDRAWRNTGVFREMLKAVEQGAEDRYAYSQLLVFKQGHDHGIALKCGYEPTEIVYQKVFEV